MNFGGPLAKLAKTNGKEACSDGEADENKECLLINSDDEVVACSNNMLKKFYKKPISGNIITDQLKSHCRILVLVKRVSKKWKRRKLRRNQIDILVTIAVIVIDRIILLMISC